MWIDDEFPVPSPVPYLRHRGVSWIPGVAEMRGRSPTKRTVDAGTQPETEEKELDVTLPVDPAPAKKAVKEAAEDVPQEGDPSRATTGIPAKGPAEAPDAAEGGRADRKPAQEAGGEMEYERREKQAYTADLAPRQPKSPRKQEVGGLLPASERYSLDWSGMPPIPPGARRVPSEEVRSLPPTPCGSSHLTAGMLDTSYDRRTAHQRMVGDIGAWSSGDWSATAHYGSGVYKTQSPTANLRALPPPTALPLDNAGVIGLYGSGCMQQQPAARSSGGGRMVGDIGAWPSYLNNERRDSPSMRSQHGSLTLPATAGHVQTLDSWEASRLSPPPTRALHTDAPLRSSPARDVWNPPELVSLG